MKNKWLVFFEADYDYIEHYCVEVPEKKIKIAKRIIDKSGYELIGSMLEKPKYKKKSIEGMIRRLNKKFRTYNERAETKSWNEVQERLKEARENPQSEIAMSGVSPPYQEYEVSLNEYLFSCKKAVESYNKDVKENLKLKQDWEEEC